MWPFKNTTNSDLHPLLQSFSEIMTNPRCLEWFEMIDSGLTRNLPLDVAIDVQEAMNLSYSITSMAAIPSTVLIQAIKNDNLGAINKRMQRTSSSLDNAVDTSLLTRIIEWANDHELPEFRPFDAFFYKERGVPRDIRQLRNLRYLLVTDDHGITEIPEEIAKLPMLQGLCLTNNKIRAIPAALYNCPSLQRLDLEDNDITRIEDGIHTLRNVYGIDLSGNKLEHVTPDIARMPSLKHLDIRRQRNPIDFMRAADTPLSEASLIALHRLADRIDLKY
jgi:hypothetical protein